MINVVTTLVFLNGSFSFLQITRTTIKAGMSLNFGPTPPLTTELAALEHLKIDVQSCDHSSAFIFDWIFFILAGNKDNHKSLEEFDFGSALAALECLEQSSLDFKTAYSVTMNIFRKILFYF